ncbi:Chondroadherin-like protein, partial [Stegodyphus mimosarum]
MTLDHDKTFFYLAVLVQIIWLPFASGTGCIFLRDDQSIRCQNTSLEDIGESLHILTMVVMNRPQIIDVEDCSGSKQLPPIFEGISNVSIDTVRIRRSGIQALDSDVFVPVASTLRDLDLSHNALRTVPQAVAVLWALEHLNLQHNRIVFLRPTGALDGLPVLREFNLAHNYIGQAKDVADDFTQQHGYQLKASLKVDDFSLGRTVRSIESLNLRGNRLAAIPQQVSGYSLPELRHLDLSENVIGKVEELSSALLPKLEFLDFQSNRIQNIPFYSLPITLKYLDLTENPFHCDCSSIWLYDWSLANSTSIRLPTCNSPERLKEIKLEKIPWEIECPEENATFPFRYLTKGHRDYDVIQLTSSATSVTVSWKVQDPRLKDATDDKKWAIVYRRASDSPYQMTLVPTQQSLGKESVLMQRITHLQPYTSYVVCVAIVHNGKYTIEPNKCRKVTTKKSQPGEAKEGLLESGGGSSLFSSGNIRTEVDEMSVSATAITIRWQLKVLEPINPTDEETSIRHEWTIRIRRTGSDNYTDIPVYDITSTSETNGQLYEYGISDLASQTHYDVCLIDVEHRPIGDRITAMPIDTLYSNQPRVNETASCRTVQTSSNYLLYATEIAAIALACAICFIVSAVTIFLCRQKRLLKWKPKKLKKWFSKGCKERPQPIGCSKYMTTTIPRVHCEPRISEKPFDRSFVGSWNSLRLPYEDFTNTQRPEFRSFRATGYRDALTSVTIYKSGYSEC